MEAWVNQLMKDWENEEIMVLNNNNNNLYNHPQSEELEVFLGDDFQFSCGENSSPIIPSNIHLPQSLQTEQFSPLVGEIPHEVLDNQSDKDSIQENVKGGKRKRKRDEASGAYHHIVAERKRRQLHSQRFIALSALVPNLTKVDKGSILVETINYLKQLQEKVKELEEAAMANQHVESMVVVKRSEPVVVDNEEEEDDDDHRSSGDSNNNDNNNKDGASDIIIEVNVSNKTLLLKIYCEKQEGILSKIFTELEKRGMNIINCSTAPIANSSIHITIVAQTEKVGNLHVKKLVKTLESILRSP